MSRNGDSVLDTFGIELETDCMERGKLPSNLKQYFSEDHDASIETKVVKDSSTGRLFENNQETRNMMPLAIIGSEFVSKIFSFNSESEKAIHQLTGYLYSKGEPPTSERSGIHFHISMVKNLNALKNFVRISAHLEQVLFYLGGMGYEFRGVKNDCTYCRPITKFGPNVVKGSNRYYQIYNVNDLYKATTLTEFFDMYGGMNIANPPGKYYPTRYGLVTLYPILNKGTVEFRGFNKTLNPEYILAAVKFCRSICYRSLQNTRDLEENSIYTTHSKDQVIRTFEKFVNQTELGEDVKTVKTLVKIIERTPDIKLPEIYYLSHLNPDRFTVNYQNYQPNPIPLASAVSKPDFVDIHRLDREMR